MAILIANRALVAIRSLSDNERRQVYASTMLLEEEGVPRLVESGRLRLLGRGSFKSMYSMAVSSALRVVVSVADEDHVVVEDVVPHGRIEHLSAGVG